MVSLSRLYKIRRVHSSSTHPLSPRAQPLKMKHPPVAAGTTCSPSHPAAAVSAHPFPPTRHKPQRARIRLAAAAANSRWVNPRAPARPSRRGAGGGGANHRLNHLVRLGDLDAALLLVESMRDPDRPAVVPCTLLIKKLCAAGRLDDAERVLRASESAGTADAVARNTLVAGYCRAWAGSPTRSGCCPTTRRPTACRWPPTRTPAAPCSQGVERCR